MPFEKKWKFPFHFYIMHGMEYIRVANVYFFQSVKYFYNAQSWASFSLFSVFAQVCFFFNYVSSARTQLDISTAKQSIWHTCLNLEQMKINANWDNSESRVSRDFPLTKMYIVHEPKVHWRKETHHSRHFKYSSIYFVVPLDFSSIFKFNLYTIYINLFFYILYITH